MINDHWTLINPQAVPAWNRWDLHPSVVAGLALLGGLYVFLGGLRSARRHVASFLGALVVLFLALNGPLHNLSDTYLFSAHMGQHLLLTLVFPPLLLYGTPAHVIRPLLRPRWVMALGRVVTRPLAAALLFSGPIVIWHVPALYEAALRHHNLHIAQHLVFLTTAVLMWWPVLSPVPELPRIPHLLQMLYLFLLGIPMSITGAYALGLWSIPVLRRRTARGRVVRARGSADRRAVDVGAGRVDAVDRDDRHLVPILSLGPTSGC